MEDLSKVKHLMTLFLVIGLCTVVAGSKHVNIKNKLGSGNSMTLHCKSKEDDLGEHSIADGADYGWSFNDNIFGTTLFFCNVAWAKVPGYNFEAYTTARDMLRCNSGCSWIVAVEGIYGLNGQTGLWEFIYKWPN